MCVGKYCEFAGELEKFPRPPRRRAFCTAETFLQRLAVHRKAHNYNFNFSALCFALTLSSLCFSPAGRRWRAQGGGKHTAHVFTLKHVKYCLFSHVFGCFFTRRARYRPAFCTVAQRANASSVVNGILWSFQPQRRSARLSAVSTTPAAPAAHPLVLIHIDNFTSQTYIASLNY